MSCALKEPWSLEAGPRLFRARTRKPGILIADDVNLILVLLKLELEQRGFRVWLAGGGADAVTLYEQDHGDIDLVLLDVQMPGLDGPRTLAALREIDPDLLACFMTGGAGGYTLGDLARLGALGVFGKPFRAEKVADFLERLFAPALPDAVEAEPPLLTCWMGEEASPSHARPPRK
jgi:two-component system, OmpR family, response regulator